jgi:hypothetical protein
MSRRYVFGLITLVSCASPLTVAELRDAGSEAPAENVFGEAPPFGPAIVSDASSDDVDASSSRPIQGDERPASDGSED